MNLKDLFAKAEGGVLSYDQFVKLAEENKAKYADLSEGGYVSKSKYDDDLAARDTRIGALDDTIKTRDADLKNLQDQLAAAGGDTQKLADLTAQFNNLQAKYDADTAALNEKMKAQAYRHAVMDFAATQKFTSKAAQRDFVQSMLAKNLMVENDVIIGASDFVTAYSKDNADAFLKEEDNKNGNGGGNGAPPPPHFAGGTGNGVSGGGGQPNPFNFNFTGVRPHDTK